MCSRISSTILCIGLTSFEGPTWSSGHCLFRAELTKLFTCRLPNEGLNEPISLHTNTTLSKLTEIITEMNFILFPFFSSYSRMLISKNFDILTFFRKFPETIPIHPQSNTVTAWFSSWVINKTDERHGLDEYTLMFTGKCSVFGDSLLGTGLLVEMNRI